MAFLSSPAVPWGVAAVQWSLCRSLEPMDMPTPLAFVRPSSIRVSRLFVTDSSDLRESANHVSRFEDLDLGDMSSPFANGTGGTNGEGDVLTDDAWQASMVFNDEPPTRISQWMNGAPLWIKKRLNGYALQSFIDRCHTKGLDFKQMQRDTEVRLAARGNETLAALADALRFPEYYLNGVHLPIDGVNNGYVNAVQAPASHDGLYVENEAIRATVYDPAIEGIRAHLSTHDRCRLLFAGSGFGGDAVNFVERVRRVAPEILPHLHIDLVDLSPHFLDVGADEVPYRLANGEMEQHGVDGGRFERVVPPVFLEGDVPISVNAAGLGYRSESGVIRNLYLMDISAPDCVDALRQRGGGPYDFTFCLYTFHEMPEARICASIRNLQALGDQPPLFFQDMHFAKKIENMRQQDLAGYMQSLLLSFVFAGTEGYSGSPSSYKIPALLSEFGEFVPFNQTDAVREEATIQSGVVISD